MPTQTLLPSGVASAEALGAAYVQATIGPAGIASAEASGSAAIKGPLQFILPPGIKAALVGIPALAGGVPEMQLFIAGANKSAYLLRSTARISRQLGGRATCDFDMTDPDGTHRPERGQPVKITEFNHLEFGGEIDTVVAVFEDQTLRPRYQVTCLDWGAICDRRLVTQDYPDGSIGSSVIQDIVANALSGENITTNNVGGFFVLVGALSYRFRKVTDVFNELAKISLDAEQWWIDFNKDLHFVPVAGGPAAPFAVATNNGTYRKLQVRFTRENYRNVQYVRTSINIQTVERHEQIIAYAGQQAFRTLFPVTSKPRIFVDSVEQTVLAIGVDPGASLGWYYAPNGYGVFDTAIIGVGLLAGQVVDIYYGSFMLNSVAVQDDAAIAARAAIDQGSGRYENVWDQRDLEFDAAEQLAAGLLREYAAMPVYVQYETDRPDLEPGMLQTVAVPELGVASAAFLVTQISSQSIDGVDLGHSSSFRRTVSLSSAQNDGNQFSWVERLVARTELAAPAAQHDVATLAVTGGPLAVGGSVGNPYIVKRPGTIDYLKAAINSLSADGPVTVDVKLNGASILAKGKPVRIDPTDPAQTSLSFAANLASDFIPVVTDDVITFDILTVGRGFAGSGLTVVVGILTPQ